jgi:hypothetical protein
MKLLFGLILSALMITANAQNTAPKETTVFFNSFSWSPDGTKLCFSVIVMKNGVFDGKLWEIGSVAIRDQKTVRITDNQFDDDWPVYLPDQKKIAFQTDRDGSPQIYLMNADGTHLQRVSNNTFHEMHPAWSPDGKKIMFISDHDGNQEIYEMNIDGCRRCRFGHVDRLFHNNKQSSSHPATITKYSCPARPSTLPLSPMLSRPCSPSLDQCQHQPKLISTNMKHSAM